MKIYSFRCQNCRYGRSTGTGRISACILATSHSLRLNHHVLTYESDLKTLSVVVIQENDPQSQSQLGDEPPF